MKWSAKLEAAALAVAEDVLSDIKIAEAAGVTKKTLESWKREPEFQSRVKTFVKDISEEMQQYGVARKARRIARLNGDYKALRQIVLDRAAFYERERRETEARIKALEARSEEAEARSQSLELESKEAQSEEAEARSQSLELESKEAQAAKQDSERLAREAVHLRGNPCFHPGMDTGWLLVQSKQHGVDIVLDAGTEAALRAIEQQAAKELGQWTEKSKIEHDFSNLTDGELIQAALAEAKSAVTGNGKTGPDA